jgi:leader peptidase (prepilin peptidase)/N-methyltransferase
VIGATVGLVTIAVQGRSLRLALPFGPFLALAALSYLFFGSRLVDWIFVPLMQLGA